METSIFLARLIGFYYLLVGGFCLLRQNDFKNMIQDFFVSKALLGLSGFISLIIGLAIVIGHPIYTLDWRGFITLIGYLGIVKGISLVWFPVYVQSFVKNTFQKHFTSLIGIPFVLGIILIYFGYRM